MNHIDIKWERKNLQKNRHTHTLSTHIHIEFVYSFEYFECQTQKNIIQTKKKYEIKVQLERYNGNIFANEILFKTKWKEKQNLFYLHI